MRFLGGILGRSLGAGQLVHKCTPDHARGYAAAQMPGRARPLQPSLTPAAWLGAAWLVTVAAAPTTAWAAPGTADRLGGVESQGPATRSLTAVHHNPAMLGALAASGAQASFTTGLDQQWVRRNQISSATGAPVDALGPRIALANPTFRFFAAASFYFDPVAVGFGIYDLSSRYRFHSSPALRYHLAPDPDLGPDANRAARAGGGCLRAGLGVCPPDGGQTEFSQDVTVALAWNAGALQVGLAAHFPVVRSRFAFDEDTELGAPGEPGPGSCASKEDPACAERVGFKGWTRWLTPGRATPGFDAALTFGLAARLPGRRITLGARYRTFPLRRGGRVVQSGVALVCRPNAPEEPSGGSGVALCANANTIRATLSERVPQEIALGGSFVLGRAKLWSLDTNLYWIDRCAGGLRPGRCRGDGGQTLSLVGLDADAFADPKVRRARARQDVFGVDTYAMYRLRSALSLTFAGHLASPSVQPDAMTAADNEGWRLGVSAGTVVRVRESDFLLIPGYGVDLYLPHTVSASRARFDPTARTAFEAAGGDLNDPAAKTVLAGYGRPTNAGRYAAMLHTFTLAVRWAERGRRE